MALVVNTNVASITSQMYVNQTNKDMGDTMARLSSGKRINTAADDAAGVAIASRLQAEVRGTNQAVRNASDAQAMIDTAEGAQVEIANILQRMRELSVQAANDTNGTADRTNLQAEITQLKDEIDRIAEVTSWAGIKLLNGLNDGGSGAKAFSFQIGSATGAADSMSVSMSAMNSTALSLLDANATVTIENITDTAGAGGDPVVENLENTTDSTGTSLTAADTANDGEYDIAIGNYTTGETLSLDIEGTTVTFTTGDASYADDVAGAAAGLAAAINAAGITGITATDDATDTVTITKTPTASVSKTDDNELTVASFDQNETISVDLDGTTISVTNSSTSGYTQDIAGTAAMLADAINAEDIPGITASVSGGVISLSKGNFDITTVAGAEAAIDAIDTAIATVNTQRANLGAYSNRLDHTVANLSNVAINLEDGRSRIEDADFAQESANLAKNQILLQAGTAMLAQANASQQNVLSLLG